MKAIDFLTQKSVEVLRNQISDIDNSYKNPWDLLAELLQNSVDAIIEKSQKNTSFSKGNIEIFIDKDDKSLTIKDNGIGIDKNALPILLAPHSTSKRKNKKTIGEKGVGLTFVVFCSNFFKIKTGRKNSGFVEGLIKGARNWKETDNEELPPKIVLTDLDNFDKDSGTEIFIKDITSDRAVFFNLDLNQLEFLIRSVTAVGNTLKLWNPKLYGNLDINVWLKIKENNHIEERRIPFKFFSPVEEVIGQKGKPFKLKDFEEYIKEISRPDVTDNRKRQLLSGKVVVYKKEFEDKGRKVKVYAFYLPSRKHWDKLNEVNGIIKKFENYDENEENNLIPIKLKPGILISVKGMPTGIYLAQPTTGASSYWNYIFMLLEYDELSFDIGRKSIHPSQVRFLQKFARKVFNDFRKYIIKWSTPYIDDADTNKSKTEIFGELETYPNLDTNISRFKKRPKEQEAMVAAIFFELLGKGYFKNFVPLYTGYKSKYDLYGLWFKKENRPHKIALEFKYSPKSILKDFEEERKLFEELDVLICWEVTEKDISAFERKNLYIEKIDKSIISLDRYEDITFPHSSYKVLSDFTRDPMYIVSLKDILETPK